MDVTKLTKICLIVLLICSGAISAEAKDFTIPPVDPAEAQRVRIWVPVERQVCQTSVDIMDSTGFAVRHFIHEQLKPGYYNFYWDKKDDSGQFVPAGQYQYRISTCGKVDARFVTAEYARGELACSVEPAESYSSPAFHIDVHNDSTSISLEIYNRRGKLVTMPFKDSVFSTGSFDYVWKPDSTVRPGVYKFIITVGDFSHVFDRRYTGK